MSMYPVRSVNITDNSTGSVTFTNIPQNFSHMQIRVLSRSNVATGTWDWLYLYAINGAGSGNFTYHQFYGDGSSQYAGGTGAGSYSAFCAYIPTANVTANMFGTCFIDIFDYNSTSKNKIIRTMWGFDANGSGQAGFVSNTSFSVLGTSAINSLTVALSSPNTFTSGTKMDLYVFDTSLRSGA